MQTNSFRFKNDTVALIGGGEIPVFIIWDHKAKLPFEICPEGYLLSFVDLDYDYNNEA